MLRMSPRKVRLVVDVVRGLRVNDALTHLQFMPKAAAKPVWKLLKSAIANAEHNQQLNAADLWVKTAYVDGGPVLKRSHPRAHGRAAPIRKRTSHIMLVLDTEPPKMKVARPGKKFVGVDKEKRVQRVKKIA